MSLHDCNKKTKQRNELGQILYFLESRLKITILGHEELHNGAKMADTWTNYIIFRAQDNYFVILKTVFWSKQGFLI